MHVFISVFFVAPLGGLQSHVRAQIKAIRAAGHEVTVLSKPGPFSAQAVSLGASVVTTDFSDINASVKVALAAGPYDLVHAHPFAARAVGAEVASGMNAPFILTLHGMYVDGVEEHRSRLFRVLTVSAAIRDRIVAENLADPYQIDVLPNGVDLDVFRPTEPQSAWWANAEELRALAANGSKHKVLIPTRLDPDKRFILDVLMDGWRSHSDDDKDDLHWIVVGDGSLRSDCERAASELNDAKGKRVVSFVGWQDDQSLAELYTFADVAVAPGRCALESMACRTPTIAMGSKGYDGPVDGDSWARCAYGNFGGYGQRHDSYVPGTLLSDIRALMSSQRGSLDLGGLTQRLTQEHFAQDQLDRRLITLYEAAISCARPTRTWRDTTPREWEFSAPNTVWSIPESLDLVIRENGADIVANLAEDAHVYLVTGGGGFTTPPDEPALHVEPARRYGISVDMEIVAGSPRLQLWCIEYDSRQRVSHTRSQLRTGHNRLEFRASPTTKQVRVAIRIAGSGSIRLTRPALEQANDIAR